VEQIQGMTIPEAIRLGLLIAGCIGGLSLIAKALSSMRAQFGRLNVKTPDPVHAAAGSRFGTPAVDVVPQAIAHTQPPLKRQVDTGIILKSVAFFVVGVAIVSFTGVRSYDIITRPTVELPDQILGLDAAPLGSPLASQVQPLSVALPRNVKQQIYGDTSGFVFVARGIEDGEDSSATEMAKAIAKSEAGGGLGVQFADEASEGIGRASCKPLASGVSVCLWSQDSDWMFVMFAALTGTPEQNLEAIKEELALP